MGKVMSLEVAVKYRQQLRLAGQSIVFTNGLFDLLHVGHLDYLERARALGDALFIGVNSDSSSRALKGKRHPIMPQDERCRLIASLEVVDVVVLFDALTATELIRSLVPDVYAKGGDYARKAWPERVAAEELGCQVELIPFLEGYSTSALIQSVLTRFCDDGPGS